MGLKLFSALFLHAHGSLSRCLGEFFFACFYPPPFSPTMKWFTPHFPPFQMSAHPNDPFFGRIISSSGGPTLRFSYWFFLLLSFSFLLTGTAIPALSRSSRASSPIVPSSFDVSTSSRSTR